MAVPQTKAAEIMQKKGEEISSHQVISLLMDGALERIGQAIMAIHAGNTEEKGVLVNKLVAIINGLRNSLNLDDGGEIAQNLNDLYLYMIDRLEVELDTELLSGLTEVRTLIMEVKSGWDNMDYRIPSLSAG